MFYKLDELRIVVDNLSPGIVGVTETWFNSEIPDDCVSVANYQIFRSDRSQRLGSGVSMYIHESFKPAKINQPEIDGIESLFINFPDLSLSVWCLYVPPQLSSCIHREISDKLVNIYDSILHSFPEMKFVIMGDFNDLNTNLFQTNFVCINRVTKPTRGDAILDQVWISEELEESFPADAEIRPPLSTSDHSVAFLKSTLPLKRNMVVKTVFDYRRNNIDNFLQRLHSSCFRKVYDGENVDEKCHSFYEIFFDALSMIPRREVVMTMQDKPWMTPLLKLMIEDKWVAYRTRNWPVFNHLKEKIKLEILKAKRNWSDRIQKRDKNVWNIVREIQGKQKNNTYPDIGPKGSSFVSELTDVFNSYFNDRPDTELRHLSNEEWDINVDSMVVHHHLTRLKSNQATGYDGISAFLLRESADVICEPLAHIFESSIRSRTFPLYWKNAYVKPIPKVRKPTINDYRPISLLSIISKLFERIVILNMKNLLLE